MTHTKVRETVTLYQRALRVQTLVENTLASLLPALPPPPAAQLEAVIKAISMHIDDSNLVTHRFFWKNSKTQGAVLYLEGMADPKLVSQAVLTNLLKIPKPSGSELRLPVGKVEPLTEFSQILEHILQGNTVILSDGNPTAWQAGTQGFKTRSISEPQTERNVLGPKQAFIESLQVNLTLVRRYLETSQLRVRTVTVGTRTKTKIALVYLGDVADPDLVAAAQARLAAIHKDEILSSGRIRGYIRDDPYSPFPTVLSTERPEQVAFFVATGRIALLVDGDPFALIAPATLWDFYQTTDDFTHDYWGGSFMRIVRFIGVLIGLLTPGLYVSFVSVHPELLPPDLALSMVGSREGVPFPAVGEMALMLVVFEILREVSIRMPKVMGQTLGVVGGLVIGQASVAAGIISNLMVVVIAVTALSLFTAPKFEVSVPWRILSWGGLIMGTIFGLYGMSLFVGLIVFHLSSLESFGASYLSPVAPWAKEGLFNTFVRLPQRWVLKRPTTTSPEDVISGSPYRQPFQEPKVHSARLRGRS